MFDKTRNYAQIRITAQEDFIFIRYKGEQQMPRARILLVEGDLFSAATLRITLIKSGYMLTSHVSTGEDALQKAKEEKPDLILMEISLEGELDGIQAAKEIKKDFSIPIIFLTSHSDSKILNRAMSLKPDGYIIKPFTEEELRNSIKLALFKQKMKGRK